MDPVKVSAQFAAYVWYTSVKNESAAVKQKAARFARAHWRAFLPSAHEGVGRLLTTIAAGRSHRRNLVAAGE